MSCDIRELQLKLLEMLKDFDKYCEANHIQYFLAGGNVLGAVRHKGFIPWDDDIDVYLTRENYDKLLNTFENNEKYYLQKDTVDFPLQYSKLRLNGTTFIEDVGYRRKYKKLHQGLFIDIFPLDKVSTNKFQSKLQKLFSNILIAQSLAVRGYKRITVKKFILMFMTILLLPLRSYFYNYVKKFNSDENCKQYCDYYGLVKKVYFKKENVENIKEKLQFEDASFYVMTDYIQYLTDTYGDFMQLPSKEQQQAAIHAKFVSLTESYEKFI